MTLITNPAAIIDDTGASAPTFADIVAWLQSQWQTIYGSDVYLAADSMDGQLLGVIALAIQDCNNAVIAAYNSYSPLTASGAALDTVVAINSITRLANETDAQLRARQQLSTQAFNTGYAGGLRAGLLALPGIKSVSIVDNGFTGDISVPVGYLAVCVQTQAGFDATATATVLFNNRPLAPFFVSPVNNTTKLIQDANNNYYSISFSTPSVAEIYASITVYPLATSYITTIQNTVQTYLSSLPVGAPVVPANLFPVVNAVLPAGMYTVSASVGLAANTLTQSPLNINWYHVPIVSSPAHVAVVASA